jgi:hypothetical protein
VICIVRLDLAEHGKFRLTKKEGSLIPLLFDDQKYTYMIARPRVAAMGSTGS